MMLTPCRAIVYGMKTSTANIVLHDFRDTGIPGLPSWSPFALKVHYALSLGKLRYETHRVRSPTELRPLSPTLQVPVMSIDDEIIYDSTRILTRITELAPNLLAHGERARAE